MKARKQERHPVTSRLEYTNTYNCAIKLGGHIAFASNNKKLKHEDVANSIGPWAVEEFNSFKNSLQNSQSQNKKKKIPERIQKFKITKTKNNYDVANEEQIVIIHIDEGDRIKQAKRRTKTESQANNCLTRIRLNTIQVSNNLHMIPSQKYFSEEAQHRKMSMNKFRTTLQETSRSKSTNINSNFFQSKADIEKKIQGKMANFCQSNLWTEASAVNKRLKTIESQNESPLMFFFEAKNNKNMMEREKNIMKIRNLSKRNKRVRTEGI